MTVLDIISLLHDDAEAVIYDGNWDIIAEHNGKDSIPNELNNRKVVMLIPRTDGKLAIEIAE